MHQTWIDRPWAWAVRATATLALLAAAWGSSQAASFVVGPSGLPYSLRGALQLAADGDEIQVLAGDYYGDVGLVTQKKLTIKGIGKRPVFRANGRSVENKGILVVRAGEVTVENIEFRGARVPDGNGAGIRLDSGKLTVNRCAFFDNEIGLLTGNAADTELTIFDSEFGDAPNAIGSLPHLLYAGRIAKLSVTGSRFHEGFEGHLIKSRSRESTITYNFIHDGWAGSASYEIDLPNGGIATIIGNVIGQGPDAQNRTLVAFGSEGRPWPSSALYMSHNTLLTPGMFPARVLRVFDDRLPPNTPVHVINNLVAGLGLLELGNGGTFEGNRHTLGRWLRNPGVADYALPDDSSKRGSVAPARAGKVDLTPKAEFALPVGTKPLAAQPRWTPGAFQN
jgi:hypothetical protein